MLPAAGSQRCPFSSPVCVRLEEGGVSPLGKRKQIVGLITHEQWLRGQRGARSRVVSSGTAASASGDLAPRGSVPWALQSTC